MFNCDHLPSRDDSITCFYKPVTCDSPPTITEGAILINATNKDVYELHGVVQYECINETLEMIGNNSITCMHSGQWSKPPPICVYQRKNFVHPLHIVLPILIISLLVFIIRIIMIKVKLRTIQFLSRDRDFDAFVCYKFDTDNDYVINVILEKIEEMYYPPLRLCVHERDFLPGLHIKHNIEDAITKSNSAIIVMSQAFIDSEWCQEEFAHCYLENMKDPAFKIFMIMMHPVECLDNLSEYMQSFIASRTYLSKYDPNLFQKVVSYLQWVKLPKDDKSREPPGFETCKALLKKQENECNLTDSDIEVEFVPTDPFLSIGNNHEEIENDEHDDNEWQNEDETNDLTANIQENTQKQVKVEVHCYV